MADKQTGNFNLHFASSFSLAAAVLLSFAACANVDGLSSTKYTEYRQNLLPSNLQQIADVEKQKG